MAWSIVQSIAFTTWYVSETRIEQVKGVGSDVNNWKTFSHLCRIVNSWMTTKLPISLMKHEWKRNGENSNIFISDFSLLDQTPLVCVNRPQNTEKTYPVWLCQPPRQPARPKSPTNITLGASWWQSWDHYVPQLVSPDLITGPPPLPFISIPKHLRSFKFQFVPRIFKL